MERDAKPWDMLNPNIEKLTEELSDARLEICKLCEFYRARTNQCKKCGCFMKLKTKLENAKCPLGKW